MCCVQKNITSNVRLARELKYNCVCGEMEEWVFYKTKRAKVRPQTHLHIHKDAITLDGTAVNASFSLVIWLSH